MALVECKECGRQISKTAKACPNCGHAQKRSSGLFRTLGVIFLGFFILAVFGSLLHPDAGSNPPLEAAPPALTASQKKEILDGGRKVWARTIAEREIQKRLKAPSTAKFSGYTDTVVGYLSGGKPNEMIVKGFVDSQNSFGAMLRNNYQVIIEFAEGESEIGTIKRAELSEP